MQVEKTDCQPQTLPHLLVEKVVAFVDIFVESERLCDPHDKGEEGPDGGGVIFGSFGSLSNCDL